MDASSVWGTDAADSSTLSAAETSAALDSSGWQDASAVGGLLRRSPDGSSALAAAKEELAKLREGMREHTQAVEGLLDSPSAAGLSSSITGKLSPTRRLFCPLGRVGDRACWAGHRGLSAMSLSESNRATPSAQLSPHAKSFRPNIRAPPPTLPNILQAQNPDNGFVVYSSGGRAARQQRPSLPRWLPQAGPTDGSQTRPRLAHRAQPRRSVIRMHAPVGTPPAPRRGNRTGTSSLRVQDFSRHAHYLLHKLFALELTTSK